MALAAAACAFFDVPWPGGRDTTVRIGAVTFNLTHGTVTDAPPDVRAGIERHAGFHRLWVSGPDVSGSTFVRVALPGDYDVTALVPGMRSLAEMRALTGVR
jgi:hypothetical protein